MMGSSSQELQTALTDVSKTCHHLWEENKDLQGRFVNELGELQRLQMVIAQLEQQQRLENVFTVKQQMTELQKRAATLYEHLTQKRNDIVIKLNDGTNFATMLQTQLIGEKLFSWKNAQKLAQIGMPFDNREQLLDEIQIEFEFLADQNWQLNMFSCWMLDLLRRAPQLNDGLAQATIGKLTAITEQLNKLLFMLVSQSFIVSVQPEPVLKTQHKFVTEVRLLIGDKLGIRQHLVNTNVSVKIIAEDEAKQLSVDYDAHKEIRNNKTVGTISNDFEKLTMNERGHLAAKFNNSKLTRIAHRKPPPKGASDLKCAASMQAATDQKYALLFFITPFQMGNLSKEEQFDVWTLSLPIMVTVHGSQDCDAQVAILWHRAFASISRNPNTTDVTAVTWDNLAIMLRNKFSLFTGARRPLSDSDLAYLSEKMLMPNVADQKPITFHRFAKQAMRDDLPFSFWEWFFSIMQLIKQKLLKFWDEGWCIGFISKNDASQSMMMCQHSSFLLRFSDSQTGAVSIGFVCEEADGQKIPFHLAPFTIKDLDQLSLASRIASCPQLKDIRYMYPAIDKEEMLRFFESEERHRVGGGDSPTGYIQSEIVMVAKTNGRMSNAPSMFGADSPSPLSVQSKLDWSPGEVHQNHMMEMSDELGQILTVSDMSGDVETLLGPAFKNNITNYNPHDGNHQHNLHFVDMSQQGMMQQHHNQFYPS
ncbi:Signal transducer and activator of transcription 1 [Caenorhabditis elegans]|uniref:Isoform c of Signal transducer and activator of transcription 1 n=1 Tax=Caenorhabditis elegans TaxID=6239 RepID=Q9NAD6-3|nr:Signal transducer and activator of transcription 1 [Caenorhabditis elegans]AAY18583.1 signal transducer and activator of transcription STA-1 [Caenorhabditis elegans]CAN99759.1 Signal transducer and activator of transcription 1 [Caenorhabditis elegans]|eukprot:NP_001122815.1 Signal transducer and activator of transcription 1 [Caenorhabditis elegans]